MTVEVCTIKKIKKLTSAAFDLWVEAPKIAAEARPGQFVAVKCEGFTLRRPISLCEIDRAGLIRLVYEVRGDGTEWLSRQVEGESIDVLGPLGNGFELENTDRPVVFVGGGIGVPPLLAASRPFGGNADAILGFRSADAVILEDDFAQNCAVTLCTDDGSAGRKGLVADPLRERLEISPCAAVYACGPRPMLKAVAELCRKMGVPCFVSMEERMACGVGACLSCACKVKRGGKEQYAHVCKNGPVFDAEVIVW